MAFLDFLKRPKNGHAKPPAERRTDLDAALSRIAEDREAAQALLAGLESRRETMLRDDAPDVAIMRLDEEGDAARVQLEKLDLWEAELHARLSEVEGIEADVEWRRLFDVRHQVACDFASSFNETCRLMFAVRSASGAAAANPIARQFGLMTEPPPLILSAESLQRFLREIEQMSDIESRRRAAVDRRAAGAVTTAEV